MISRDAANRIVKKTVSPKVTPSVGNVALIGATSVELNNTLIGGNSITLDAASIAYTSTTAGTATASKAVVVDAQRNVTGVNHLTVDELYVGGTKVTGVVNSGAVVSNSPVMNDIYPGAVTGLKAVSADANASVHGIADVQASTLKINDGTIKTAYTDTMFERNLEQSLQFVERVNHVPVVLGTALAPSGTVTEPALHVMKVNNFYGYFPVAYSVSGFTTTNNRWLKVRSNLTSATTTLSIASNYRYSNINECSFRYIPEIDKYVHTVLVSTVATGYPNSGTALTGAVYKCFTWTDIDPTPVISTITTPSVSISTSNNTGASFYYSPELSKLVMLCYDTATQNKIMCSSDGVTWTVLYTITQANYSFFGTSSSIPLITVGNGKLWLLSTVTSSTAALSSTDGTTWSTITKNATTVTHYYGYRIIYIASTNKFFIVNTFDSKACFVTTDFTTLTPCSLGLYVGKVPIFVYKDGYIFSSTLCGTTVCDATTGATIEFLPHVSHNGVNLYVDGNMNNTQTYNYMYHYNYIPNVSVKVPNYTPTQYLDFESYITNGLYDFVYSAEKGGYFVLGCIDDLLSAQATNANVYFSKDLKSFTTLSKLSITTATNIEYDPDGDLLIVYGYGLSATANMLISPDGGLTWSAPAYVSVLTTATNTISRMMYSRVIRAWVCCYRTSASYGYVVVIDTDAIIGVDTTKSFAVYNSNVVIIPSIAGFANVSKSLLHVVLCTDAANGRSGSVLNFIRMSYACYTSAIMQSCAGHTTMYTRGQSIAATISYPPSDGLNGSLMIMNNGSDNQYFTPVEGAVYAGYNPNAASWLPPEYIQPLNIWVALKASPAADTFTIIYSTSDGNLWMPLYNTRVKSIVVKNPKALKYNPIDGYLYILGGVSTFRTKLSVVKNNVVASRLDMRTACSTGYSLKSGYEIYKTISAAIPSAIASKSWKGIDYGYGAYIAVSDDTITTYTSPYASSTQTLTGAWKGVAYGTHAYKWIAVGTNIVAFSSETSQTPTMASSALTGLWTDIGYSFKQRKWVIVGANVVGVCTDGATFTTTTLNGSWNRVVFTGGMWVAIGSNVIAYSSDATSWTTISLTGSWKSVAWGGRFVVVGDSAVAIGFSLDALTKTVVSKSYNDVCFVDELEQFILVGNSALTVFKASDNIADRIEVTTTANIARCLFAHRLNAVVLAGDSYIGFTNSVGAGIDNTLVKNISNNIVTDDGTTASSLSFRDTGTNNQYLTLAYNGVADGQVRVMNTTDNTSAYIGHYASQTMSVSADVLNLSTRKLLLNKSEFTPSGTDWNMLGGVIANTSQASKAIKSSSGSITVGALKTNGVFVNGVLYSPTITPAIGDAGQSQANKALVVGSNSIATNVLNTTDLKVGDITLSNTQKSGEKWSFSYITEYGYPYMVKDVIYHPAWKMFIAIVNPNEGNQGTKFAFNSANTDKMFYFISRDGITWTRKQTGLAFIPVSLLHDYGTAPYASSYIGGNYSQGCVYILGTSDETKSGTTVSNLYMLLNPDTCVNLNSYSFLNTTTTGTLNKGDAFGTNSSIPWVHWVGNSQSAVYVSSPYGLSLAQYNTPVANLGGFTGVVKALFAGNASNAPSYIVFSGTTNVVCTTADRASPLTTTKSTGMTSIADVIVDATSGARFYFCGSGGQVCVSSVLSYDATYATTSTALSGLTFTITTINASCAFKSIAYNAYSTKFCVVDGTLGYIYVSSAGSFSGWAQVTTGIPNGQLLWSMIRPAAEKGFVVAAQNNTTAWSSSMLSIVDSTNTFVAGNAHLTYNVGKGTYAFGKWLIPIVSAVYSKLLQSSDGIMWSNGTLTETTGRTAFGIAYSSSLGVAVIPTGEKIYSSSDGITWTLRYTNPDSTAISRWCEWVPALGLFMVPFLSSTVVYNFVTSPDGINWTQQSILTSAGVSCKQLGAIAYSPSLGKAVMMLMDTSTETNTNGYYSSDGLVWTLSPISSTYRMKTLTCSWTIPLQWSESNGYFMMVNSATSVECISYDGMNWVTKSRSCNVTNNLLAGNNQTCSTMVDGLGEVAIYTNSSSNSYNIALITKQTIRELGCLNGLYNGTAPYTFVSYAADKNRLLVYKYSLPASYTVREMFQVIDLDEASKYTTAEVCVDRLANLYKAPQITSAVANWNILSMSGYSFTGHMRWICGTIVATCGSTALTSGNQLMYCTSFDNLYTGWAKFAADTAKFPDNTVVTGLAELPDINSFVVAQSAKTLMQYRGGTTASITALLSFAGETCVYYSPKHRCLFFPTSTTVVCSYDVNLNITTATTETYSSFYQIMTLPIACTISALLYIPTGDRLVGFPSSGTDFVYLEGDKWLNSAFSQNFGNVLAAAFSPKLGLAIAVSSTGYILSSTTGLGWTGVQQAGYTFTDVIWVGELEAFVATSSTASTTPILYSVDGNTWIPVTLASSVSAYSVCWCDPYGCLAVAAGDKIVFSIPVVSRHGNTIRTSNRTQHLTTSNGDIRSTPLGGLWCAAGSGTFNPNTQTFQLYISADSAYKPTTTTWTVTSDARLKKDIQDADIDRCSEIVDKLPLKYFKWKDEFIEETSTEDKHKLGWIAQDVQPFFPRSVTSGPRYGIDDALNLNSDQLIACMYGSVQQLGKRMSKLRDDIASL